MIRDLFGCLLCWIGWHTPTTVVHPRGINTVSVCRRCGRMIMQDSQGNWF